MTITEEVRLKRALDILAGIEKAVVQDTAKKLPRSASEDTPEFRSVAMERTKMVVQIYCHEALRGVISSIGPV